MSESLNLSVEDLADPAVSAGLQHLIGRAAWFDHQPPFSDQTLVDARTGSRTLLVGLRADVVVAAAILGQGELEFVVDPEWRGVGFGTATLEQVLASGRTGLLAWAHGDHPVARALAASHGFAAVRTLLHLELEPLAAPKVRVPEGVVLADARDLDPAEWVALNARVFAAHPEQGRLTEQDLAARRAEPWFDEGDFLLLRDADGSLIGYDWLKIEPGSTTGEIYVLGVAPEAAGRGLGRTLLSAGLARMLERGCTTADLYVEAENRSAVALYRSLGFTDASVDVQYLQRAAPVR
ncbi:mycothiol synthase [Rathayibacter tritici]|uniref:Mycothiol acetyltransferase n=1 Tax=Rathayibacter tritici TaxID=33888 RepID=A0A161J2Q9_9MICO|nr:mycothiol synthase [Rathayibacter tritici]AND15875.1 mycothiol synthase [Rathayibacter tritici]PPF27242.1 mycothiol synthase [Rathayibacter tritici]PPF66607.1 mycothiol synthase [Rathayibacter tritici]PPG06167.1 mycothiol synthase [Rathayibacter tritici]PPI15635.1 mycothiol synthase [Rathayibacter tritici]